MMSHHFLNNKFIFDDVCMVKKDACRCGPLIRVGRDKEWGKVDEMFLPFFFPFLYWVEAEGDGEWAALSSLSNPVPRDGEWPLCHLGLPDVGRVPSLLLKWFS